MNSMNNYTFDGRYTPLALFDTELDIQTSSGVFTILQGMPQFSVSNSNATLAKF